VLEAVDVKKHFGGVHALKGVSLRLRQGAVVGLIGPNCLSGSIAPTSGAIRVGGEAIVGMPANRVARLGIVRTFQSIRLFRGLTACQNVEISALAAGRVARRRSRAYALELLDELGTGGLATRDAGTLSYGDQRRVEIARALAANPRFLLLDEPAAGMNDSESDELRASIERIRSERGCGVLVVEHDLRLIMQLSETIYVLNEGELIATGTPDDVRTNPAVVTAYIGSEERS
jgi:ABC-type branched-subunit amino acid transport system ATPase component